MRALDRSPAAPCGTDDCDASPYRLRGRLRRVTESQRERDCGVLPCRDGGPVLEATGSPGAWDVRWRGVVTCRHIWTCPVCSRRLRAERLARLLRAVRNGAGTWVMVTLTVRHRDGMPLAALLRGLMRAWRRARQGGAMQRIWTERVSASARATEITHGSNGWHPHLHVLVRSSEWSEDERETLLERWRTAVARELGPACVPNEERAIRWSTPIEATSKEDSERIAYMFKLALELAGGGKRGRKGSVTPWDLARMATEGDGWARERWLEYARATKGRRMIELDDRAVGFARKPDDTEAGEGERERLTMYVDALELRALREYERRADPGVIGAIMASLQAAERPKQALEAWIELVTRWLRYHPRHAPQAPRPLPPHACRDGP